MRRTATGIAAIGYILTIVAANAAIRRWGIVPVGWGLSAPAGVYFAGLAFTLRDLVHEGAGRRATLAAIVAGVAVSAVVSPALAVASGLAFGLSELADLAVYEPLRSRGWAAAALASGMVGSVIDSVIFLWLAFGTLDHLAGQVVGKWEVTAAFVLVITVSRYGRRRALAVG